MLPPNYPIAIECRCEPLVASFAEGSSQRSSFAPTRTVQLNYLLDEIEQNSLTNLLDSAGGVGIFDWDFRPQFADYQWRVGSYRQQIWDDGRLYETTIALEQIRTAKPIAIPTSPLLLDLTPDSPPSITTNYRIRSPQMGFFPDRRTEPINPVVEQIELISTVEPQIADNIDVLLDRCRATYPLIWQGKSYLCADWAITYYPESAQVSLTLNSYF